MKDKLKSLYIGCGDDRREGFLHCDIREMEGIDVACKAWQVSEHFSDLAQIYSRHMLEHLTTMEAEAALLDWHKALSIGGQLYIVVPNLDFHVHQWLKAEWNESTLRDERSDARYGFAGLFGWQRECDPRQEDYNNSYWDVHKSGYNEKRLAFLLKRAGYVDVKTEIKNQVHLVATATKSMQRGERQIAPEYKNIRDDHKHRYSFAYEYLADKDIHSVLDLACGIGYGSKMIATNLDAYVTGVDIDNGAIDYANQYYHHPKVNYVEGDAREIHFPELFDAVVSFETIEHVDFDKDLLSTFFKALKSGGYFICSTPNQDVMPFDPVKFRFHVKHYTNDELVDLVESAGFEVVEVNKQENNIDSKVESGNNGSFIIFVCRKP
ncbi:MAG: methyltransferase domain-containing protein [Aestuariibacter sp.]